MLAAAAPSSLPTLDKSDTDEAGETTGVLCAEVVVLYSVRAFVVLGALTFSKLKPLFLASVTKASLENLTSALSNAFLG